MTLGLRGSPVEISTTLRAFCAKSLLLDRFCMVQSCHTRKPHDLWIQTDPLPQLPASFAQKPLGSLSGYELTWYYFGYSHAYTYILGIIQIVSATLLLFRTSSLIAAMVMLPVMTNIVMINFFYWIGWGPMRTSLFNTVALLLILWREREALRELFWNSQKSEARTSRVHWIARSVVLLYAALTLLASTVGANAFKNFADSYQRQHPNEKPK